MNRDDFDSPWKEALENRFPEFLALLFPEIHTKVDWSRDREFLDKELQQVVQDAELGRRYADKLVKVWALDGREAWVLIHVEVQGEAEKAFAERMYIYHYRPTACLIATEWTWKSGVRSQIDENGKVGYYW